MGKNIITVHNVPLIIRPIYLLLSWVLALVIYLLFVLFHITCRIEYKGNYSSGSAQNYIFCMWHHNLIPYFIVNIRYKSKYVWLNHAAWFMKPVHNILYLIGTKKIVFGSSGHSGKEALSEVIHYLRNGYNTLITPDGPSGPVKELKNGVLEMGLATWLYIVPIKIKTPKAWVLKSTWDSKRIPLPFSRVIVEFGNPVKITHENYETARQQIIEQL